MSPGQVVSVLLYTRTYADEEQFCPLQNIITPVDMDSTKAFVSSL